MGKDLSITTKLYVFRSPVLIGGKWRCRKRHLATGETTHTTLEAIGVREAREEVRELAQRQKAEELRTERADHCESVVRDAFVQWLQQLSVRRATREGYQRATNSFGRLLGEERLVRSLAYRDVGRLFSEHWGERAGRTKLLYHGLLVRWFDWCVKQGYCEVNHARDVTVQREWKKQASRAAHTTGVGLSLEDSSIFLNVCEDISPSLWWFVFISLRTGLRKSNVLGSDHKPGLLWKNVDLEEGVLFIENEEFVKNGFPLRLPLHDELLRRLREVGPGRPENLVVPEAGRPPRKDHEFKVVGDLKKQFCDAKKQAAPLLNIPSTVFEKFRPHDLKHTYGRWLGARVPDSVKKALLGHAEANVDVTERYTLVDDLGVLRAELNKLPWLTKDAQRRKARGQA